MGWMVVAAPIVAKVASSALEKKDDKSPQAPAAQPAAQGSQDLGNALRGGSQPLDVTIAGKRGWFIINESAGIQQQPPAPPQPPAESGGGGIKEMLGGVLGAIGGGGGDKKGGLLGGLI